MFCAKIQIEFKLNFAWEKMTKQTTKSFLDFKAFGQLRSPSQNANQDKKRGRDSKKVCLECLRKRSFFKEVAERGGCKMLNRPGFFSHQLSFQVFLDLPSLGSMSHDWCDERRRSVSLSKKSHFTMMPILVSLLLSVPIT